MPISSLLFTSTLIFGTITSLTAPNWLIAWLGIEINLLSFIPLISFHPISPSADKTSAACKYFLAQATGSVLLLLAPTIWLTQWDKLTPIFFLLALMTKAGIAPIYQWFPSTIASLRWPSASILLTWQKLTPLLLLFNLDLPSSITFPLLIIATANSLIGAINGLAQTQLRPLLAYSSIAHIGWIIAISCISSPAANGYLFGYILMISPLLLLFLSRRASSPKTTAILKIISPPILGATALLLLNLAGLPPLGGFSLKAVSLSLLTPSSPLIALILILSSVATLGFYINITLISLISSFQSITPHTHLPTHISWTLRLAILAAAALPIFPLLLA